MRTALAAVVTMLSGCSAASFEAVAQGDSAIIPEDTSSEVGVVDATIPDAAVPPDAPEAGVRDAASDDVLPVIDAAPPEPGRAIKLDGSGYATLPFTSGYIAASGFSWEMWFRPDAVPSDSANGVAQVLLGVVDGAPCEDVYLAFGSETTAKNALAFVVDGGGDCSVRNFTPVSFRPSAGFVNGKWYHVVAVRNYAANKVQIYLNGVGAAEQTFIRNPITRALHASVGRWWDGATLSDARFKGTIDELRIYNRPLTAAEVAAHYGAGLGVKGIGTEPGLVSGWHFDEDDGSACADYGPAGRTATLGGGTSRVMGIVPR